MPDYTPGLSQSTASGFRKRVLYCNIVIYKVYSDQDLDVKTDISCAAVLTKVAHLASDKVLAIALLDKLSVPLIPG